MTFRILQLPSAAPRALVTAVTTAVALGCTDRSATRPLAEPAPQVVPVAELVLSSVRPTVGDTLRVVLQVSSAAAAQRVASFTGAVAYDSTRLAFVGEDARDDGAIRALNDVGGRVRVAGAAPRGFGDGQLIVLRFRTLAPDAPASLRLELDEVHAADRSNLLPTITVSRTPRGAR